MLRFIKRDAGCNVSGDILTRLLSARGITGEAETQAYLRPSMDALHDELLLSDMPKAVALLTEARDNGLSCVVYGDYDCDGVCATAIMLGALRRFGINADSYTPKRSEGYGLNRNAVSALAEKYRILITVDLGITNYDEVLLARQLGMTVIVTDHHDLPISGRECPAHAVINPRLNDYPFPYLCGAGVAWKTARALLGHEIADSWLDLAGLATIADLVPLTGENRVIAAYGIQALDRRERPGIDALTRVSKTQKVDSGACGFQLGPRLNAAGRIGDAEAAVRLLMSEDTSEAIALANTLEELNETRKKMQDQLIGQVQPEVDKHDFVRKPMLIIRGKNWAHGVIGLAAGKLTSTYYRPSCVLSEDPATGLLTGSLRSVNGVHIAECLKRCDDLLIRYGGHEMAGGVTLSALHYEEFCERMQQAVAAAGEKCLIPAIEYDLEVSLRECSEKLVFDLALMEPYGQSNPAPLLRAKGLGVDVCQNKGAEGNHLIMTLREGSRTVKAVAWNMGRMAPPPGVQLDAVFSLEMNEYRDSRTLQMNLKGFRVDEESAGKVLLNTPADTLHENLLRRLRDTMATEAVPFEGQPADAEQMREALREHAFGNLVVCAVPETAIALTRGIEMDRRAAGDVLCQNTLLTDASPMMIRGCWSDIWLADGGVSGTEAAVWHRYLPDACIHILPRDPALCGMAAALLRTEDGEVLGRRHAGRIWKLIRSGELRRMTPEAAAAACGLTPPQALLCLRALAGIGQIRLEENPFRAEITEGVTTPLDASPLLCALRALAGQS